jgi:GT2 family glycosyltransferase
MVAINGFDESYGLAILGDDTDLSWRFKAYGAELYSSKNLANIFHLYHIQGVRASCDTEKHLERFTTRQKNNEFVCEEIYGVSKYVK